jgi:hypothetical protein
MKDSDHAHYEDEWRAKCETARRDGLVTAANWFEGQVPATERKELIVRTLRRMAEGELR